VPWNGFLPDTGQSSCCTKVEGYEHQEIAEMLSCSVGNSKSQLYKARLRFRELLAPTFEARLATRDGLSGAKRRSKPKLGNWALRIGAQCGNAAISREPTASTNSVTVASPQN